MDAEQIEFRETNFPADTFFAMIAIPISNDQLINSNPAKVIQALVKELGAEVLGVSDECKKLIIGDDESTMTAIMIVGETLEVPYE